MAIVGVKTLGDLLALVKLGVGGIETKIAAGGDRVKGLALQKVKESDSVESKEVCWGRAVCIAYNYNIAAGKGVRY